jgi:hypothetical protein
MKPKMKALSLGAIPIPQGKNNNNIFCSEQIAVILLS